MVLEQTVASLIDLQYQALHAHWNYKGPDFYPYHLLFDRIYDDIGGFVDRVGERVAGMGQEAPGNITKAASLSVLSKQTDNPAEYVQDLIAKLGEFKKVNLRNIDLLLTSRANDQASANILIEIDEKLDQLIYLLTPKGSGADE